MRQLMLGNKAFARGLYEGGCSIVSSYPGTPSTEVTEEAVKFEEIYCEWAPNEKVALETAFGASLAGKRSFCGMKHVGLNVAADPLFTCSYTGVNGGLIICVADDPAMHSSQNEQDSRHYAIAAKVPMQSQQILQKPVSLQRQLMKFQRSLTHQLSFACAQELRIHRALLIRKSVSVRRQSHTKKMSESMS